MVHGMSKEASGLRLAARIPTIGTDASSTEAYVRSSASIPRKTKQEMRGNKA